MRWHSVLAGLIGFSAIASSAPADDPGITILFHVRPPYSDSNGGHTVKGLLAEPVTGALEKAGLGAEWVEMPPARQTEEIKRTNAITCGLGWFKRPEREAFALFSAPIYRDQPTVVVARQGDARFADRMSLQDSFRDASRKLIVKTGYSYGATIDGWIEELQPHSESSAGANDQLLGMIALERADYAIMAPEEADYLLATVPELGASLRTVTLADAPAGELRYLMCSRTTPPEVIERISRALPSVTAE